MITANYAQSLKKVAEDMGGAIYLVTPKEYCQYTAYTSKSKAMTVPNLETMTKVEEDAIIPSDPFHCIKDSDGNLFYYYTENKTWYVIKERESEIFLKCCDLVPANNTNIIDFKYPGAIEAVKYNTKTALEYFATLERTIKISNYSSQLYTRQMISKRRIIIEFVFDRDEFKNDRNLITSTVIKELKKLLKPVADNLTLTSENPIVSEEADRKISLTYYCEGKA